MNYQFTNDKPIYLQIMDAFKTAIVSGELKPGGRLDSVRDLAMAAKVNPNTMQKALSELERIKPCFFQDDGTEHERCLSYDVYTFRDPVHGGSREVLC